MKKLITILSLIIGLLVVPAFAADTLQVDITKMTSDQLKVYQELKIQQQRAEQAQQATQGPTIAGVSVDALDKYAQMGRGLGVAINEGLGAVTKNVESFSQTSAGKWLMVLITWKVMGADAIDLARTAVQWTIGGTMLLVGVPFWIWLVRRNCVQRPIATVVKTSFWVKKVIYHSDEPIHQQFIALYGLCFLIYLAAVALITFLH